MEEEVNEKEQSNNLKIVGINLGVLAFYTILCGFIKGVPGILLDALLLAIHVVTCLIIAAVANKNKWLLSAFVVLLIGVSTCVGILFKLQ